MRIKFTKTGANSAFGGFSAGDIFNCGDALGRHLVEEAKVAEYAQAAPVQTSAPAADAAEAASSAKPRARKAK